MLHPSPFTLTVTVYVTPALTETKSLDENDSNVDQPLVALTNTEVFTVLPSDPSIVKSTLTGEPYFLAARSDTGAEKSASLLNE